MKNRDIRIKKQYGFTLIELMVVVAIIAILTTIGVGGYANAMRRGRDSRRRSDIQALSQALTLFRMDWGYFPSVEEYFAAAGENPTSCTGGTTCRSFGDYIPRPQLFDPRSVNHNATRFERTGPSIPYTYFCHAQSGGRCRSFIVCAKLEGRDGGNLDIHSSVTSVEDGMPSGSHGIGGVTTNGLTGMFTIVGSVDGDLQWYCAASI